MLSIYDFLSIRIKGCQFSVSMKYRQFIVCVTMNPYLYLDIVVAILILRDLKGQSTEVDNISFCASHRVFLSFVLNLKRRINKWLPWIGRVSADHKTRV